MVLDPRNSVNVNGHDDWESAVDQVLAICDNDPRTALRTLLIANEYLNGEMERLQAMISNGYARGAATKPRRAHRG
jgi:hypothetical protein